MVPTSVLCYVIIMVLIVYSTPMEDQKPFDCPAGEQYYKCSQAKCFKTCEQLKNPPPCPFIAADCYRPSCECQSDYLRNEDKVCVPYQECSGYTVTTKNCREEDDFLTCSR